MGSKYLCERCRKNFKDMVNIKISRTLSFYLCRKCSLKLSRKLERFFDHDM